MIHLTINGKEVSTEGSDSILKVCQKNQIFIPTLCYHPDLEAQGNCRLCIVEANGKIVSSCNTIIQEGMKIVTESEEIHRIRKTILELLLGNCSEGLLERDTEFADIAKRLGVTTTPFKKRIDKKKDESTLLFDNNKCILCGKCIQKCQVIQEVFAICYSNRGCDTEIGSYFDRNLIESVCVYCGQCSLACPTGAIIEKDETEEVLSAIHDPAKHVIVQTAPSIRASIGEMLGFPPGAKVTGKLVTALKKLGFDRVVDTNFGADLTIIEEGTELIERLHTNGPLPLITSCSPGWILFMEHFYPELLHNVSTCKSPMEMTGPLIKTYYAKKNKFDPKDIVSVAIMPCVAKKFEAERIEMCASGYRDVDYVLTTRELGRMIQKSGLDFKHLPDTPFDSLMGISTGAAMIFAVTGGVMEAALRFAADKLENKDLAKIDYTEVRGLKGVKEADIEIAGMKLHIGIAHGLANAHRLLGLVQKGERQFHFIEIMACEGGCIGGGGQPQPTTKEIIRKRTQGVYAIDKHLHFRKSHQNPEIKKVYEDFLGEPGGHKAHELLHTTYIKRNCL